MKQVRLSSFVFLGALVVSSFFFAFSASAQEDPNVDALLNDLLGEANAETVDSTTPGGTSADVVAPPEVPTESTSAEEEANMNPVAPADPLVPTETAATTTPSTTTTENTQNTQETTTSSSSTSTPQGTLPASASVELSVVNLSQENKNAVEVGARPGDLLRFELKIVSNSEDVKDYVARFRFNEGSDILEFVNVGLGVLSADNQEVVFPPFSNKAPCEQIFTVVAQVKPDCKGKTRLVVQAEGKSVSIPLSCGLAQTGPEQQWFLLLGIALLLGGMIFGIYTRKQA